MRKTVLLSKWTTKMLRTLLNSDGSDVTCPRCGLNIRHSIGMGGPTGLRLRQWHFDGERWEHRCKEHSDD
jgi:hypothetical protein